MSESNEKKPDLKADADVELAPTKTVESENKHAPKTDDELKMTNKSTDEDVKEASTEEGLQKKVSFNSNHIEPEKLSNPPSDDNLVKSPSILKKSVEQPPTKPPRPLSPREQAKNTLKEAFPNAEEKYINAVLIASEGDIAPAFNALLYLSDPDSKVEVPEPKAKPPVPPKSYQRTLQLEEDEKLARKLALQYGSSRPNRPARPPKPVSRPRNRHDDEDSDPDVINQFLDEDLPQIKKQFEKGFEETKQKVGTFFSGFTKQFQEFSGENNSNNDYNYNNMDFKINRNRQGRNESHYNDSKHNNGPQDESKLFGALGSLGSPPTSARSSATFRRERNYDDDLDDLNHKYSTITLSNNDKDLPNVPIAANNNEHSTPKKPALEKQESTDLYGTPKVSKGLFDNTNKDTGNKKGNNKWEPLADVPPQPVTDDAFLVTSSDDEDDDEDEHKNSEKK